ncbi:MAG: helix-turn-helix transcriptional regulator [Cardiobacteriaceae bacterium]|nr:helix-turn-helix transcriptional regulator [Cardiobacteriaceae bacterium]
MNNSGKRLNILKKQHNLTNEKIGEWFGITPQSVQLWIDKGIPSKRIEALAKKFNVSARWLMVGENEYEELTQLRENQARKEIAVRLVEERARKNLTQFELSQKTGFSIEAIQDFEFADKDITSDYIKHLSEQGFDLNYIFGGYRSSQDRESSINYSNIGDGNNIKIQNQHSKK